MFEMTCSCAVGSEAGASSLPIHRCDCIPGDLIFSTRDNSNSNCKQGARALVCGADAGLVDVITDCCAIHMLS